MLPARIYGGPCAAITRTCALLALLSTLLLAGMGAASAARADSLDPPELGLPVAGEVVKQSPRFTWAPVPRASKYRIQVSTTAAFSTVTYAVDVHGPTATPIAELPLGSLHWRVAAYDGAKVLGQYSASRSFARVQRDAPQLVAPADDAALAYPTDPAVLSWKPVAGIEKYVVEIDDESTFTGATSYTTAGTSLALPTALPSNVKRFWRVQGISTDPSVTTAWSDVTDLRSFSIAWPASAKPALLAPVDSLVVDRDELEFSWSPVPGAAKYEIQTSTAEDFTTQLTTQVTAATRYRPTETMTQDQYYWRVRALQANGEPTSWSSVWRFKREWLDAGGQPARPQVTLVDADPLVNGTQLQQDRISVAWTPVPRAAYYELEISTDPSFLSTSTTVRRTCKTPHPQWTPYLAGSYTGTAAGFGGCAWTGTSSSAASTRFIIPGSTYYVRVRAVDQTPSGALRTTLWSNAAREGEGGAPPTASFSTFAPSGLGTDPTQPAVPVASPDSAGTPKLTWQPVAGAEAYLVALARDSSFNSRVLSGDGYVVTTNTELVLNQPLLDNSAGQPYFWFVLPCVRYDAAADNDNQCTVGENQAINIPGRYASFNKLGRAVEGLTAEAVQTDTVALGWQEQLATSPDGGGVKWYEVEVRNAANAVVDTVKTDAAGYSPMDETYADGQHTWRVRAVDAAGTPLAWSAASAAGSFQKRSSVPAPQAPANEGGLPVLRWGATAFAGSYDVEVYRGTDPAFPAGNRVGSAGATGRRYPVSTPMSALPADTYSWRVRQVDAYGRPGPWSTEVLPFTVGASAPVLSKPVEGTSVGLPSLVFEWGTVPGAVRYRFESSTTPGFGTIVETVLTTQAAYAPVGTYAGDTIYHWRVSALNAAGDTLATSTPSSVRSLTAPAAPAATAKPVAADIEVAWQKPLTGGSDITGYIVRLRPFGSAAWTERTVAGDVLSTTFAELMSNQRYEAQVAAQNAIGVGPFSSVASATTPSAPSAPSNLALTPAIRGFTASWRAPSTSSLPITGYVVRVTPTAGGTPVESTVPGTTTTLTGLADSTTYTVDVAAENAVGRSPFVSVQGTTLPAPPPPDTTISSGPANGATIGTRSASFAFAGSPAASTSGFECKLDAGEFEPCTSPKVLTELAEGPHTLLVRARDAYGSADQTPAQRSFAVDATAPDTSIATAPATGTTETSATFTYAGAPDADAARFECKLDGGAFEPCPAAGRTYAGLAPGAHTFAVRALDRAANADPTPATHSWTIAAAPAPAPTPAPAPSATPGAPGPSTPPVDPRVADEAKLVAALAGLPSSATAAKHRRSVSFRLPAEALPHGAVISLKLADSRGTLGSGRATARTGVTTTVKLTLSSRARKLLRSKRRFRAALRASATAASGAAATKARTVTVKAKR